jgi:hypothetical protein
LRICGALESTRAPRRAEGWQSLRMITKHDLNDAKPRGGRQVLKRRYLESSTARVKSALPLEGLAADFDAETLTRADLS